jgi:phosphogluconate dehydratase
MLDARAIVNAVVALLATGGSTNHTLHLPAIAAAAGLHLRWDDIAALSSAVPLLTRMYPNGSADVNHFHQAGGMAFLIAELLDAGLLHEDLPTVAGHGLRAYRGAPHLAGESLHWAPAARVSGDHAVLRPAHEPFATDGGLRMLAGNLGEAVIKVSAVKPEYHCIEAPVRVFSDQHAVREAFEAGELARDVIVVVRHQGPRANGMPELHQLTPLLGVLQDRGHRVALVTDGRMSGASGKVPAAIHLTPEAVAGGPIARLRDGDLLRLDATQGTLDVLVDAGEFHARPAAPPPPAHYDCGQDMFALFRRNVGPASSGGSVFHYPGDIA